LWYNTNMELPKHTCISCAYLCQKADEPYGISPRSMILEKGNELVVGADYIYLVCYEENLTSFYISGKTAEEIRNIVISTNTCKQWTQFTNGISPIATEQRESSKWTKWAFWGIIATLIVAIATLIVALVTCAS